MKAAEIIILALVSALPLGGLLWVLSHLDTEPSRRDLQRAAWVCAAHCVENGGKAATCRIECEDFHGVR